MNEDKQAKLEAKGWRVGSAETSCVSLVSANAQGRVHSVVRRPDLEPCLGKGVAERS